jgi:hypothetical protein
VDEFFDGNVSGFVVEFVSGNSVGISAQFASDALLRDHMYACQNPIVHLKDYSN